MDKKMIKEMAKVMDIDCGECYTCEYYESKGINCTCLLQARELYNAGYRKIPENAVVLTREEHQKYLAFKIIEPQVRGCLDRERELEKQVRELDKELNLAKSVLSYDDEMPLAKWEQTIRKETAEKFAERLIEKINENRESIGSRVAFICDIENVCKEITEGQK